jgi:DNA-binding response OmpR family regulator
MEQEDLDMAAETKKKILLVEDDLDISHLVRLHLRDLGYEVEIAADGTKGLNRALTTQYDLIILDLMLPGIDGMEVCRRLRAQPDYTPVLMLTAKSSEIDRVLGLEMGADDYLTKPFSIRELLARVKAIFRRVEVLGTGQPEDKSDVLAVDDLVLDAAKRKVTLSGEPVQLTSREFELLQHFAQNPGRVYTRSQLLDQVWGYGYEGYEHTVNSHINRLRGKIENDPANPRFIKTVWGVGYKFADREELAQARDQDEAGDGP